MIENNAGFFLDYSQSAILDNIITFANCVLLQWCLYTKIHDHSRVTLLNTITYNFSSVNFHLILLEPMFCWRCLINKAKTHMRATISNQNNILQEPRWDIYLCSHLHCAFTMEVGFCFSHFRIYFLQKRLKILRRKQLSDHEERPTQQMFSVVMW